MKKILWFFLVIPAAWLSGCVHYRPIPHNPNALEALPLVTKPTSIQAVGYGSMNQFPQYTPGQQKLMAMRAAKVDAYRALAEQVYGFRISGNTTVSAFATQNDSASSYVDAFIRGAKVLNIIAIADGNFEATVELELPPSFSSCLINRNLAGGCIPPTPAWVDPYPTYEVSCDGFSCRGPARLSYPSGYYGYWGW